MSAPPNGLPNNANRPPGAPPPRRRRPPPTNPLVPRKRPIAPPPQQSKPANTSKAKPGASRPTAHITYGVTAPKVDQKTQEEWKQRRRQNGGWWDPPPAAEDFSEVSVFMTKADIKEGLRAHVMRFAKTRTSGAVDIMDDTQFPRPVTLHRKDARDLNHAVQDDKEASGSPAPVDPVEAERLAKIKADKEAQRAMDQAQIAPVSREAGAKKTAKPERIPEAKAFYAKRSAERKKENNIKYEESLPWVMEDADGKSAFISQYMGPLSESMVALQFEGNQVRAIPLEKYYKFTHKPPFKAYSIEEAEALMKKQTVPGRWHMRQNEREQARSEMDATRQALYGRSMVKTESTTFKSAARSEKQEHDDIDFSGDEFQDDEENPIFEHDNDEEAKDSKDRVRREQLGANLFGEADEKEIEEELKREEAEEEARKRLGKSLTKHLVKYEKHLEYKEDPDDSEDLGLSSSSDEESEAEKEEVKQEDEQKNAPDQKAGAAPKGPNATSSSSKLKAAPDSKKVNNLKRAASPNLSEMESSGNESSRKRAKKTATGSGRATPVPNSQRPQKASGAASDGEATAGEMSDGGRPKMFKKKSKLVVAHHGKSTPTGSRAGSPVPGSSQLASGAQPQSRAGSPSAPDGALTLTAEDIIACLNAHPEGILISQLASYFKGAMGDRKHFISLVKNHARWGPDKLLRPKLP